MPDSASTRPDRTLPIILGLIATLVVVAVVVVFTRGAPEQFDPATPEGTVQQYVTAVIDGDQAAAAELLAPAWLDECDPLGYAQTPAQLRMSLLSSSERDTTAIVRVTISLGTGDGPFGVSDIEYDDSFQLTKQGGAWLISNMPWDVATCPSKGTQS